jgi:hypothetical protein
LGGKKSLAPTAGMAARIAFLEASGSGYTGLDDPRFAEFIKNVTFRLFPPKNPTNPNFRDGQSGHHHRIHVMLGGQRPNRVVNRFGAASAFFAHQQSAVFLPVCAARLTGPRAA